MDELDDLIRAADPGTRHRTDPLTPRAEAELARLVRRHRARLWRRAVLATAAVAVLIALGGVAVIVGLPDRATAKTPELMHFTATSLSVPAVVDKAANQLDARPTIGETRAGVITLHQWALKTIIGAHDRIISSATEPSVHTLTFAADGTVRLRIVAAAPFPGETTHGLPKKGTVLGSEYMKPGTYDDLYADTIPTDTRGVGAWLAQSLGVKNPTNGEYLHSLGELMTGRLVTNQQQATLVRFIASLANVSVAGRTTDRLGRSAVVLTTADRNPGKFRDYLLLSATTGQIIGTETIYTGHDRTDIASPSVMAYESWTQSFR